jgi:cytidylate kinase
MAAAEPDPASRNLLYGGVPGSGRSAMANRLAAHAAVKLADGWSVTEIDDKDWMAWEFSCDQRSTTRE